MLKKQGFTLIELIIVIVILGIIAAVAAPKLVNLSRDARIASLQGIQGAMSSTSLLVHVKAQVEGVTDGNVEIDGTSVTVDNGYISGHWNNAWRYALNVGEEIGFTNVNATCTVNDICGVGFQSSETGLPSSLSLTGERGLVMIWFKGDSLSDLCYAFYYNPGNAAPTTGYVDTGC